MAGQHIQERSTIRNNFMVIYKQRFITVAECWYTVPSLSCRADILHYLQLESPLEGSQQREFKTIWIDLTKSEDDLFSAMKPNTRTRIRRASRGKLVYQFWHLDATAQLHTFYDFFEQHAIDRRWRQEMLRWTCAHAEHGSLDLSKISDAEGRILVWHAYYRDQQHARLKYSVSLSRTSNPDLRSAIGRANRYHTWQDIQRFKGAGVSVYDFGGWYSGNDDAKLLGVNRFKEEFGGRVVTTFHCSRALTAKGRLYLCAADIRARLSHTSFQYFRRNPSRTSATLPAG
jgi:hypothetical protein